MTVIGHSAGGYVATALAGQRPGLVSALALIDTAPDLDAVMDQGLLGRLPLAPLPGRLLWRLRTEVTIRKALASAFTRPIDIPGTIIEATMGMTHRALAATSRASDDYLKQQTLPGRLAALGLPVLVIVGADDKRWRSTSAAAYRAVPGARLELLPGVGHTPMMEDRKRLAPCCWTSPRPPGIRADSAPAVAVPVPEVARRPSGLSPGGTCRLQNKTFCGQSTASPCP